MISVFKALKELKLSKDWVLKEEPTNKTEFENEEVHYWIYLYRYIGKKAYVDEILKKHKTLRRKLSSIFHHCVKEALKGYVADYKRRIKKEFGIKNNTKTYIFPKNTILSNV